MVFDLTSPLGEILDVSLEVRYWYLGEAKIVQVLRDRSGLSSCLEVGNLLANVSWKCQLKASGDEGSLGDEVPELGFAAFIAAAASRSLALRPLVISRLESTRSVTSSICALKFPLLSSS